MPKIRENEPADGARVTAEPVTEAQYVAAMDRHGTPAWTLDDQALTERYLAQVSTEYGDAEADEPEQPAPEVAEAPAATEYDALTVDQLREELRNRELPTSGNKPDLIKALVADDVQRAELNVP